MARGVSAPAEVLELPFRVESYGFGLRWQSPSSADIAFSCCLFGADGKLQGYVGYGQTAAPEGAVTHQVAPLKHSIDKELISIKPSHLDSSCEALVFVVSLASDELMPLDLCEPEEIMLSIYATEPEGEPTTLATCELRSHAVPEHSSLLACVLYRTAKGWQLQFALEPHAHACWGDLVPQIKALLPGLPGFAAGRLEPIDPAERAVLLRNHGDHALDELAAGPPAASAPADVAESRRSAGASAGPAATANRVTRVRVDIGWRLALVPLRRNEDGDPPEEAVPEWSCTVFSLECEELFAASAQNKDAEGFSSMPEPEEAEPNKDPPSKPEEAEIPEADGPAEGEDGPEALEPGAELDEEPAKPPPQEDEAAFPLKDSFIVSFAELPKEAHSLVLLVSNFGEGGLKQVRSVHVRLTDVSGDGIVQPVALGSLGHYRIILRRIAAGPSHTSILACKLYKEATTSAFTQWCSAGKLGLTSWLADTAKLLAAFADMFVKQSAGLKLKQTLIKLRDDNKDVPAELAAQEDAGWQWRLRCSAALLEGASLEDCAADLQTLANYEGRLGGKLKHHAVRAKASMRSGDTFYGEYQDGLRMGPGLYLFCGGGAYGGSFERSKRHGNGLLLLPDGARYLGGFARDRFDGHGQYEYPDGNKHVGAWSAGEKHGRGTFWTVGGGGCIVGLWDRGILTGSGTFDRPAFHFEGCFEATGVVAGACSYIINFAQRAKSLSPLAAAHILAREGCTISATGTYTFTPDTTETDAEQEEAIVAAPPTYPKFTGLYFASANGPPHTVADIPFPPASALAPAVYV